MSADRLSEAKKCMGSTSATNIYIGLITSGLLGWLILEIERLRHPSRQISAMNYMPCYEVGSSKENCDGYHTQEMEIKRLRKILEGGGVKHDYHNERVKELQAKIMEKDKEILKVQADIEQEQEERTSQTGRGPAY